VVKEQIHYEGLTDKTVFCYNGLSALAKSVEIISQATVSNPISLMLVDYMMPQMNGIELIGKIKDYIKTLN
jgi:CheY-like chemotaxis protein